VHETNRYAQQFFTTFPEKKDSAYYKKWQPTNVIEIRCFMMMIAYMGINKIPQISFY
jgi:hypothetical protein